MQHSSCAMAFVAKLHESSPKRSMFFVILYDVNIILIYYADRDDLVSLNGKLILRLQK